MPNNLGTCDRFAGLGRAGWLAGALVDCCGGASLLAGCQSMSVEGKSRTKSGGALEKLEVRVSERYAQVLKGWTTL